MYLFDRHYDEALELVDVGVCCVFVPVSGGIYRAIFAPAGQKVRYRMMKDPVGFAITATKKTREYAIKQGYELED
jgi:hypothetical protein